MTLYEPQDADDPTASLPDNEQLALNEYRGAALVRLCGIDLFEVTMPTHGGAETDVELVSVHVNALDCLVEKAAEQDIRLQFKRTSAQ
ncbi:MAG: hypothetical protein WBH10_00415 [Allopontixanthobacter sediminis]